MLFYTTFPIVDSAGDVGSSTLDVMENSVK